jgi:hypothetical protein
MGITNKAQRLQAAAWVLRKAPAGAANAAEVLLHIAEVPINSAERLVSAGARVSYAQLLAAAHSMVAGVEVWGRAQRELGVPSDIPAAAEAICCRPVGDIYVNWVSQVLLHYRCCLLNRITCALKLYNVACNAVHGVWSTCLRRYCFKIVGNIASTKLHRCRHDSVRSCM